MNRNMVTNLGTPSEPRDAAPKEYVDLAVDNMTNYVDSRVQYFDVAILANKWVGDAAPYTQTIQVKDMQAKYRPHYGPLYSENTKTALAEKEAWMLIDDMDTADGSVTFTCFEDKPQTNVNIQMEVNR
jgi:hypothetical protein